MSATAQRTLIGHVGVDTAQLVITDPSYLDAWDHSDTAAGVELNDYPYSRAGASLCCGTEDGAGILDGGLAAAVSTGYGDGLYPVYVEYDDSGRVARVIVEFIPPIVDVDADMITLADAVAFGAAKLPADELERS
jgi:hypothetical protein